MFKTKWNAEFDDVNERYRRRILTKEEEDELKIIRKANIMVRNNFFYQLIIYFKNFMAYEKLQVVWIFILFFNFFNFKVRREALKQLFLSELRAYEEELNARGLCIHKERLWF